MQRAIVIGAGITGLTAAWVLREHFDEVVLLERDELPETASARRLLPHGHHVHLLLARGYQVLDQLFPGLFDELARLGAPLLDLTRDMRVLTPPGTWLPSFTSGITTRTCSRNLLDWAIRERLRAAHNIRVLDGCSATGWIHDRATATVLGVNVRDERSAHARTEHALLGSWIVDASGRQSQTPAWLAAEGYGTPRSKVVNAFLGYASRTYEAPAHASGWKMLSIMRNPTGGLIFPVEHNRWIVTLSGVAKHYPPTDETGFLEFASKLASPLLYDAIRSAMPCSKIHGFRRTENRRFFYEQLPRWPDGFVVIGDAVCAFNPVYAQGMTVGILAAQALDECLRQHAASVRRGSSRGLARRFQRQLARQHDAPWRSATVQDLRWAHDLPESRSLKLKAMRSYIDHATQLAARDPHVCRALMEAVNLLRPVSGLFTWSIAPRVLWRMTRDRLC